MGKEININPEEEQIDYLKEVNQNINMAKILSEVPEKNRKEVFKLLQKKRAICSGYDFFGGIKLAIIKWKIKKLSK